MEFKTKKEVDQVLSALGEQIAALGGAPVDLLVCGGSALQALGLVGRTTKDVDIVALVSKGPEGKLHMGTAKPLPAHVEKAAKKVARDFGLMDGWLNPGPTSALDLGLPVGVLERAEARDYGRFLTVRFISRFDQIHFKLYAAVDQGGKHYSDLLELNPSAEELEKAALWSMTHDVSEVYRQEAKRMLAGMGFKDVADRI